MLQKSIKKLIGPKLIEIFVINNHNKFNINKIKNKNSKNINLKKKNYLEALRIAKYRVTKLVRIIHNNSNELYNHFF